MLDAIFARFAIPIAAGMAFIIAAQGIYTYSLKRTVRAHEATIASLTGELAVCNANTATLKASIARQNDAIATARVKARAEQERAARASLDAAAGRKAPAIEGTGVDAMNQFMREVFQ